MPVNLQQSPRNLEEIAQSVVAHPTVGKKFLHSSVFAPHRRAVQSKGAAASYALGGLKKLGSIALAQIPVPAVGAIVDKAWVACAEALRAKHHKNHVAYPVDLAEKVKFELKDLGKDVEQWDNHRWKVSHAAEQYNKAAQGALKSMETAPCDTWVRVWAKYLYLGKRIGRLRASIDAMRAVLLEMDAWLDSVEQSYDATHTQLKAQYDKDVTQLKTMQAHDTCSDVKCMFKSGQYTKLASVPTSDAANFLIKAAATVAAAVGDPTSDLIDAATSD
jgi:hypothetical protein